MRNSRETSNAISKRLWLARTEVPYLRVKLSTRLRVSCHRPWRLRDNRECRWDDGKNSKIHSPDTRNECDKTQLYYRHARRRSPFADRRSTCEYQCVQRRDCLGSDISATLPNRCESIMNSLIRRIFVCITSV